MEIDINGLRDRRIAASDETNSVANFPIYGRGSWGRRRGTTRLMRREAYCDCAGNRCKKKYGDTGYQRVQCRGDKLVRWNRTDRKPSDIKAIILHQTAGRFFLPDTRSAYPTQVQRDLRVSHSHAIDRIAAHFVVINDGTIFYTHDIEFVINSAGGGRGIDIEFAGRFSNERRLSPHLILAGRMLVSELRRSIPSISHIHPHGQVQKPNRHGRCGKLHTCPGPDIWVNVGQWAVQRFHLECNRPLSGYQNNGISNRQRNTEFAQQNILPRIMSDLRQSGSG